MEIWNVTNFLTTPENPGAVDAEEHTVMSLAGRSGEVVVPPLIDNITLYWHKVLLRGGDAALPNTFRWEEGHSADWNPILPILYGFPDIYHYIDSSDAGAAIYSYSKCGFLYIDTTKDTYWEILQGFAQIMG